jgi:hypothetical protein
VLEALSSEDLRELDTEMGLEIDIDQGRQVAGVLYNVFTTIGIFGDKFLPEDEPPQGVEVGTLEHLMFLTLTVSIDYQRDAARLWDNSRKTWEDPETRYLFDPRALHETPPRKIQKDMQKYGLSQKPVRDADIWRRVGVTFYKKWQGNPLHFLESCDWNAPAILKDLKEEKHTYNGKRVSDYPNLRGDKIGPLWLRILSTEMGFSQLKNMDKVPIPVDVHIARATLTTGVVKGDFEGRLGDLFGYVRRAWFESVKGLRAGDRPMIALDVDEPLWHLSRSGCSKRNKKTGICLKKENCVVSNFCVNGKISVEKGRVVLDT